LIYSGSLSSMPARALGSFAAGEARTYKFVALLPAGGTAAADDPYQGSIAAVEFVWSGVAAGPSPGPAPAPSPGATPTPTPTPAPTPTGDRTPPRVTLAGAARQSLKRQKGAVVLTAVCNETCSLAGTGRPDGRQTPKGLRMGWATRPAPKGATTMTLKLDKRSHAAIIKALKARKRPVIHVTIIATDAAGNATTVTKKITLAH